MKNKKARAAAFTKQRQRESHERRLVTEGNVSEGAMLAMFSPAHLVAAANPNITMHTVQKLYGYHDLDPKIMERQPYTRKPMLSPTILLFQSTHNKYFRMSAIEYDSILGIMAKSTAGHDHEMEDTLAHERAFDSNFDHHVPTEYEKAIAMSKSSMLGNASYGDRNARMRGCGAVRDEEEGPANGAAGLNLLAKSTSSAVTELDERIGALGLMCDALDNEVKTKYREDQDYSTHHINLVFDRFDKDKNQSLNVVEFWECTRALEAHLTYEEVISEWEKIDNNANGTIDRVEFATWWNDYKNRIPEVHAGRHQAQAQPKEPATKEAKEGGGGLAGVFGETTNREERNRRASAEELQEAWEEQFRQATQGMAARRGYNPRVFL